MNIQGAFRFTAAILLLQTVLAHAGYHIPDRLTQIHEPNRSISYSLDGVANRITETVTDNHQTTLNDKTYSYNSRDQLQSVQDAIIGATTSYQYDANGNQISKTDASGITTMSYGPRDRLLTITLPGAPPINYSYNDQGLRDSQSQNGQTLHYLYDQTSLIAETNSLGDEIARYTHSSVGLIAEARNGIQTYIHGDALSTPIAITDTTGAVTTRYTWDAWGNLQQQTGFSQQPFGFTGYQRDSQTGLSYAQQRYYDAEIGRFNRHDPLRGDINIPLSLHRYLYANANPTIYVDPTGEFPIFLNQSEIDKLSGGLLGIDVNSKEGIEDLRAFQAGQRKGGINAVKDAVVGTAQLAADIPGAALERASGFRIDFGSNDRLGEQAAGILQLATSPVATISTAVEQSQAQFVAAIEEGRFGDAGEQSGRFGTNAALTVSGLPAAGRSIVAVSDAVTSVSRKAANVAFRVVEDGLDTGITPMLPGSLRSQIGAIGLDADSLGVNSVRAPITDPARLLPAPGAIARQDVPAFGIVVVNSPVFKSIKDSGVLGQKGSNNPGFFADPSDIVGLSDEFAVQKLGSPGLARSAVNNGEPLFGVQFPTANQPIFNVLDFDANGNFIRGGRSAIRGPDRPNSFIILGGREFNIPPEFLLPEGTIGGRIVNGALLDSEIIR